MGELQRSKQNDTLSRTRTLRRSYLSWRNLEQASYIVHPAESVTLRFVECVSGNRVYLSRASMGLVMSVGGSKTGSYDYLGYLVEKG